MNKEFNDLIKIEWKSQEEVAKELQETLKKIKEFKKRK